MQRPENLHAKRLIVPVLHVGGCKQEQEARRFDDRDDAKNAFKQEGHEGGALYRALRPTTPNG